MDTTGKSANKGAAEPSAGGGENSFRFLAPLDFLWIFLAPLDFLETAPGTFPGRSRSSDFRCGGACAQLESLSTESGADKASMAL
jgi:hypothetical protein